MRRRIRHETTIGDHHLWAISLATTAVVVAASTLMVYWNHHRCSRRDHQQQEPTQQNEERSNEKASAKKDTNRSPTFQERVVIINNEDKDQGSQYEKGDSRQNNVPSMPSLPSRNESQYPNTPQNAKTTTQPFHDSGIPTMLHVETDQETITDDDNESIATANWIHSPIRFNASKHMKKKMKNLGKKLHKITTKRRLAFVKKGLTPPPGPIFKYCPEAYV